MIEITNTFYLLRAMGRHKIENSLDSKYLISRHLFSNDADIEKIFDIYASSPTHNETHECTCKTSDALKIIEGDIVNVPDLLKTEYMRALNDIKPSINTCGKIDIIYLQEKALDRFIGFRFNIKTTDEKHLVLLKKRMTTIILHVYDNLHLQYSHYN